jgi:glycine cleavage system aminomethyltransferase T
VSGESLEAAIAQAGSPVELLRNASARPHTFPVTPEFSNWRSEQRAWRDTCALLDQSHHMADLFVRGPDALRLFGDLGVNNVSRFRPETAKQFVAVSPDGYVIGDGILFYLGADDFDFVGAHPAIVDWVHYNAETGGYDVEIERDENSLDRDGPPKLYRYELQGPSANAVLERVTGSPVPEVGFFHMSRFTIAGREVRALRHGMAGRPGFELFGPWQDGEQVRRALLEAGEEFGLLPAGAKAYSTANLESGWIPTPLPAIFTGEELRAFRQWRSAARAGSLGGSFASDDVADYYVTPYDLGYGRLVAFDHDFVGREALERLAHAESRTKVTLVWNAEDVEHAIGTQFGHERSAKYIDLPKARYALFQYDDVLRDGRRVGISMDCGYLYNEKAMVSLAVVDAAVAEPGTEVVVVWGEEPNSTKPQVEPHEQIEIRATVAPVPLGDFARVSYRR